MQTRRTFFAATSVLAGAAATAAAASPAQSGPFDLAAVEARLRLPFRHRQAFGTRHMSDGDIADFMLNSLNAYEFDYQEGPGTLHALGIWYGTSVAMLLDDEAWRTYRLELVQQRRGDPVKSGGGASNPYLRATSPLDPSAPRGDLHGLYHDASLTALAKRNASFLACNNALRGLATEIAVTYATSDQPAQTVLADLRRHLIPGALLVPAGVAAINQAQERSFTFFSVAE